MEVRYVEVSLYIRVEYRCEHFLAESVREFVCLRRPQMIVVVVAGSQLIVALRRLRVKSSRVRYDPTSWRASFTAARG